MTDNLQKIYKSQEKLKANFANQIKFSEPLIERLDQGVIYPNTINMIQGKSGVHKSRLAENICSSILCKDGTKEFLGFRTNISRSYNLLYVDTERNIKEQYPFALQRICESAGYSKGVIPNNFSFISLLDIDRTNRFSALKDYLTEYRAKADGHIVIILDVITDCIMNFNDPAESMKLIDLLNIMINESDVTFICLIHENPSSSDKARGHLGSEASHKGSTVIQIGFEKDTNNQNSELIKVSYLKCRSSKRFEPFYLRYSEEAKGLVCADDALVQESMDSKKRKVTLHEMKLFLAEKLTERIAKNELIEQLATHFVCVSRTIEARLSELVKSKSVVKKDLGDEYILVKRTENRMVFYELEKQVRDF